MNVNNFENHLDQQKENSSLKNKVALSGLSLLTALGWTPEAYGNAVRDQLKQNYKKEIGIVLSDESQEKQQATVHYMKALSKLGDQVAEQRDWDPVELEGTEKQAVVDEFKTSFHINGDSLNISKVIVDDPKIFDLIAKKYIGESQRTANGKYAYVQDYFLDATMNPNKDQKYADKLKTVGMDLTLQKVMRDNRHMLKLNRFWVNSKEYNVRLTESGNKMLFNNLLVFDVKGATPIEERIKSVEVNYDRNATKERLESEISKLPFKLNLDRKVLKDMPSYMDHIDLARLLQTSIKWSSQTKLENATNEKDDLKNWSRALVVNGATTKELTDVAVKFNDDKVAIEIQKPKDFKAKLFGFDLEFQCKVVNGGLEVEIPTEGKNGLKKFKEHFVKSFTEIWEKTNKTHLGDQNVFQNLNKVPYKVGNIMKTAVSPRIITADPSTGFETNVTSRVAPVIIRNVIENSEEGKKSDMKLVDQLGRTLAGNRIQHGKTSSISLGDKEGGYKLEEFIGADQPYTQVAFEGSEAKTLENTVKSFNAEKGEVALRNPKNNKEVARIPVKVEDQDPTPKSKKLTGYFYDTERNSVQVTADNFSYLLSQASNKDQSLILKGINLSLSDAEVYDKFKELFDKTFQGKNQLNGIVVNGRYATVDVRNEGKLITVNDNTPEKVQKILAAMRTYLNGLERLNTMSVQVSPDGRGRNGKKNRNLYESIGGEHGVGRTPVSGWKEFDIENSSNPAKYTVIDGKGNRVPLEFNLSGDRLSLEKDEIQVDGVTYNLSYDRSDNTLYLLPQKVK